MKWSVGSQVGRQTLSFAVGIALARLLTPAIFGQVAMVVVVTGFAGMLTDFGFGAALVQREDVAERHLSSVFWLNIGGGVLLTAIFALAAPLVAAFYREETLETLTVVFSLSFILGSFGIVQRTLLIKGLNFRRLAEIEMASVALGGVAAIVAAIYGWGVWSLAVNTLGSSPSRRLSCG